MDDALVRLAIVVALGLAVLATSRVARRLRQPVHPLVDLSGTDLPSGVVLFTSTDCTNCEEARAALREAKIGFREVTWELEGSLLERAGVDAVPLAVFRDPSGVTVAQLAGVPRRGAMRRAVAAMTRSGQMLGRGDELS